MPKPNQKFPTTKQEFKRRFTDEETCLEFLFQARWPNGFQCPTCNWQANDSNSTRSITCPHCGHQTSLTTNTIMHGTKKSLSEWLLGLWWLTINESGASAKNLQRLLKLSSYQTAWTWLQKMRMAMGIADQTLCQGVVEIGCRTVTPAWEGKEQTLILAAAEAILPSGITGRIRMTQINKLDAAEINSFLVNAVQSGSSIITPEETVYQSIDHAYITTQSFSNGNPHRPDELLKSFEIWLNKVHRGAVSSKHIQLYLHEFCFRNNSALLPNQEAVFAALIRGVMYDKAKPYHALVASNSQGGFNE
ncbi:MAG: IS1595 family transposase [Desulfobulbaceae bacterium]|uniref:IS1595 family transposase n=1 Tax=Candidatus Desulfatifera sulfidica TaxID=2841691 RepID=A0A8J6N8Q0_9BACT|nr:IS1595 family transposase [Candidatus Desulfatifera sulfidica]